jgi:hypothetical protein
MKLYYLDVRIGSKADICEHASTMPSNETVEKVGGWNSSQNSTPFSRARVRCFALYDRNKTKHVTF